MPSHLHETLVDLFRRDPAMAVDLLRDALGAKVPPGLTPSVAEATFTDLAPTEARTDLLVTLARDGVVSYVVVLEVQLRPDPAKRLRWPYYLAAAALRWGCPAALLVVTRDDATAAWAARPLDAGPGQLYLKPLVLTPAVVPQVRDGPSARRRPYLATLSALAHGNDPGGIAIVLEALEALSDLDTDETVGYHECIFAALDHAARSELERHMTMHKLEFESDLAKRVFAKWYYDGLAKGKAEGKAEGRAEGRAEGKAEGKAEALLAVLRARGLAVSPRREASIRACRDAQVLDAWLARAVTAGRVGEVFGRK